MSRSTPRTPSVHSSSGFSLVELSIVLIIFALLAGGLMMTLTTQQEIQRLSEVRHQLADIREALLGYAVIYGRLPPAADPTLASGTADVDAGLSKEGQETGVLPWVTLGLPETDPWGQRFTYRVTPDFANDIKKGIVPECLPKDPPPAQPAHTSFALCSPGNITVTDGSTNIATNLPVIVVSHGRNGLGGYGRDGLQRPGADGDEQKNASNNKEFVSRAQTHDFDDEVIWIPLPILMNRMVTAGKLP